MQFHCGDDMKPLYPALLWLVPTFASAGTQFVDASNPNCPGDGSESNPFCDIQSAVDAANNGDLVSVAPGVYPGGIKVHKSLTILGAGPRQTRVVSPAGTQGIAVFSGAELITVHLEGLRVEGPTDPWFPRGIDFTAVFSGRLDARARDVEVRGFGNGFYFTGPSPSRVVLEDCVVSDSGWDGIVIGGAPISAEIHGCTVVRAGERGMRLSGGTQSASITNTIITDSQWWAVEIAGTQPLLIADVLEFGNNVANPATAPTAGPFMQFIQAGGPSWIPFTPSPGPVVSADPLYRDAFASDFQLTFGSPAIDAGNTALIADPSKVYDVRGFGHPRHVDGDNDGSVELDIGAYEFGRLVASQELSILAPVQLALSGPPNGLQALFVAPLASEAIPLGQAGSLFLDPTKLILLTAGTLDAAGTANLSFGAALQPSLVGLDLPFQAVTAAPGGVQRMLTSAAIIRLTP